MAMEWKVVCKSGIERKPGMSDPSQERVTVLGNSFRGVGPDMAIPSSDVGGFGLGQDAGLNSTAPGRKCKL